MIKTLLSTPSNFSISLQNFLVVVLLIIGTTFSVQAQVANYAYAETKTGQTYGFPAGTFTTATTIVTGMSGTINNLTPVLTNIGFTFNFNGVNYTQTSVSDNGFITFGGTAPLSAYITPISVNQTPTNYNGAISCFGYDLGNASQSTSYTGLTSDVTYSVIDPDNDTSTLNSIFVIQYRNMIRRPSTLVRYTGLLNMQIRLYQGTNTVETIYDAIPVTPTVVTGLPGQLGLRGATNSDFNNRKVGAGNPDWVATAVGLLNTDTMPLTATNYPVTVTKCTWTPPCYSPISLAATTAVNSVVTWTAPTPSAAGYIYEVRSSGAFGSGATGLFTSGSITNPTVTFTATGLSEGVTYTVYVQSTCGGTVTSTTVTPPCSVATIPYSQLFETVTVPAIPNCTTVTNSGTTLVTVDRSVTPLGGFTTQNLVSTGALASNSWYFTQQIAFPSAGYYKLKYTYGGTSTAAIQKMKVAFGAVNSQAGMTTVIADHTNIKLSPITNTVNFYVSSAGNYYIGFNANAAATQGSLQLDDIFLTSTTCVFPTAMTSSQVAATSANISWTAPVSPPSGGYDYYVTPAGATATAGAFTVGALYQILTVGTTTFTGIGASANTVGVYFTATAAGSGTGTAVLVNTPASTASPTGATGAGILLTSLTGLTSSTTYYFWSRSNCGSGDISAWAATPGSFTTPFQPVLACTLSTPPTVTTTFFNNITTTGGISNIANPSGLSTNGYGDYTSLVVSQSAGASVGFTTGIAGPTVGIAVWVDWNNNGTFESGERMANTTTYISTFSGTFAVPGGQANGEYRMRFLIDYWNTNPTDPCTLVLSTTRRGEVEDYTFKVVTPPPALTLSSSSSAQCAGLNSPLVTITAGTGVGEYTSFSWNPSTGVTGTSATGYIFNPTSTVIYTLTASQTVSPFNIKTAIFTYTANPLPTALVITPSSATQCGAASAIELVATGGIVTGTAALSENFNTGAPGWSNIVGPLSTGGTPANANWTIRNSGYNPGSGTGVTSLVSNDNSQFYLSNSDSQGISGTTDVQLVSPTFDLATYTDASLSFYHYTRPYNTAYSAKVEIFNGTWNTLRTWIFSQGTQGAPTNFALVSINLNAYVGQSNLQIRFNYYDKFGFVWAVDNVLITGSSIAPTVAWTPNGVGNGLYTDSGASALYSGGNAPTIYAKPTSTQTYTATVTSPLGCIATASVPITYVPIAMGTTSADQTISVCSGTAIASISVTSYSGTAIYWEYTDDATLLTGWTTILSSNSTTLTPALIGSLANTRYFRAVTTNSTCTLKSAVITITVVSKVTWNGTAWSNITGPDATLTAVFSGNYTSTADLDACSVSILTGTVTIKSGHTLNVQNAVQVNPPGKLIFENSANLVQYLTTDTNGVAITNSGNITYNRDSTPLLRFDYTYWSAPVSPQTIVGFTPLSPLAYIYNAAGPNWVFVPNTTTMSIAKGYTIRAPTSIQAIDPLTNFTATFVGVPNTGTYTTPVFVGNYNLIGNPYPCALDANKFLDNAINPALEGTIYLWTHNTPINLAAQYTGSDYAVYNFSGGVATRPTTSTYSGVGTGKVPLGFIAAGQGFMVKGLSTGVANFTNAMRSGGTNNNQFFRTSAIAQSNTVLEKNRLWLDISNSEGAFKQILVGYIEDATNNLDRGFDGEMVDIGNVITFYTTVETKKLSIQGRALPFDVADTIPIGYKSTITGTYTITLSDFDGLFTAQNVYLEDTLTGDIHDIKNSAYSFSTAIGTFENRFVLRFTSTALAITQFHANSVLVYPNDLGLHITTGDVLMKSVKIHDVAGRLIATMDNIGKTEIVFTTLPTTQQVLLVQITAENGAIVTKKVVY